MAHLPGKCVNFNVILENYQSGGRHPQLDLQITMVLQKTKPRIHVLRMLPWLQT